MTGDFLAAFTRATPGDQILIETFTRSWKENDPSKEIRKRTIFPMAIVTWTNVKMTDAPLVLIFLIKRMCKIVDL